jgi:hypothetical protein
MPPATRIRGIQIADNTVTAADIDYTLDDAYDNGGSGAGRTITADVGPVVIDTLGDGGTGLVVTGTVTATGEISVYGNIRAMNSSGDEGGEIFLNKAVTNTTLNGGVTIDVYQNKIRFFEQGGTARGYFLDITNGGGAASTNLAAGGGTPGGSDTHVQFNDGGSFGGQSSFTFNKTTSLASVANFVVTGSAVGSLVTSGTFQVKDGSGGVVGSISAGGVISGSGDLQVGGNITGSNLRLTGDIAVIGGDLTTTATTFNFLNSTATTINFGQAAATVNVGAAASVVAVGQDLNIGGGGSKLRLGTSQQLTMLWNTNAAITNGSGQFLIQQQVPNARLENHISGTTGAGMFRVRNFTTNNSTFRDLLEVRADGSILIGSASTGGPGLSNTTISNDLFLSTGIVAVNTDGTDIQLVSSGNATIKLDANNNAAGHFFAVRDFNNVNQFRVTETGNVDIQGDVTITGSVLATTTTTTFNLLNTALTGTLNIGGAATNVFLGSNTSTGTMAGDLTVNGRTGFGAVVERVFNSNSSTGVTPFNLLAQSVFYVNNPNGDITANFTSVPTSNLRVLTPTVILSQSATPRVVNAVQVDGVGQTIKWANNVVPTGTANKQEAFGFSLIRSGSLWTVLGQMTSYG